MRRERRQVVRELIEAEACNGNEARQRERGQVVLELPTREMTPEHDKGTAGGTWAPDRIALRSPIAATAIVVFLLGQMAVAMSLSSRGDTATYDEPAGLAAGIAYTNQHDLRLNYEHPPLAKILAALPVAHSGVRLPSTAEFGAGDQWELGRRVLFDNGAGPGGVLWLARLPMMLLTLAFALVVYAFARDLFGAWAALVPLAVVTLDPNLVAHGRLVTTDVPVAGFLLLTLWLLARASRAPSPWGLLVAGGAAYGLALASKYSALVLAPVVVLLAFLVGTRASRPWLRRLARGALAAALVVAAGLAIVWGVYLAVDPGLRFSVEQPQAPGVLASIARLLPVPKPYRAGVEFQIIADKSRRPAFLFGRHYDGGLPVYYPALLAVKNPLGTLALWALSALVALRSPRRRDLVLFVLLPAAWVLGVGMQSNTNIGYRHILLVPLVLAVATGTVAATGRRAWTMAVLVLLLATAVSTWRAHPFYLSYVNEVFGGPAHAHALLSDSNVDWGQDAARLGRYLREHHLDGRVSLLWSSSVPPAEYGIRARDLCTIPPGEVRGVVVASVTALNSIYGAKFDFLRLGYRPVAEVGRSILVYDVDGSGPPRGDLAPPRCPVHDLMWPAHQGRRP